MIHTGNEIFEISEQLIIFFFLLNLVIVYLIFSAICSPFGVSFLNFDLSNSTEVSHWIAFIRDIVDFVRLGPRTSPVFVQRIESSDELSMGVTARFRLRLEVSLAALTAG